MSDYLNRLFNLEGKVAAVIGAGGHLCSELARGFARAGCAVAVMDLRPEKAQAVERELLEAGHANVMSCAIDVGRKADHEAALDAVVQRFGRVDILVNGAGINGPTPFFEIAL